MDKQNSFVVKGHIIYSDESYNLIINEDSYLLILDGKVEGVRKEIPAQETTSLIKEFHCALLVNAVITESAIPIIVPTTASINPPPYITTNPSTTPTIANRYIISE